MCNFDTPMLMKRSENEYAVPINIYPGWWKNLLLVIGCMAFAVGGCCVLNDPSVDPVKKVLGGWLGIIFFGGGGLFLFLVTLYSKIFRIPLLRIYDDRLEQYLLHKGVYRTVHFADVRRFRMIKYRSVKMVAIDYKVVPMIDKIEHSSRWMQALMIFNFPRTRAIKTITVENLDTNGKELCELLNARLKQFRKASADEKKEDIGG